MAARKEVEKTVHLREFQRTVNQLLSPEDRDYLFYAMKEYNTYKSVAKLMLALNSCLDTPEKLDLLPYVRDLIPKHDRKRFDNLAPYTRMAHPLKVHKATGDAPGKLVSASEGEDAEKSSRIITLQRGPDSSLGFSIRGGREHDLGIFISHIDSFSQAEQSGLQVGDQIMAVNGINFDRLSHSSAVLVLKSHDHLKIEVKNMGCVPGERLGRNSFIWVDSSGNPVEEQSVEETDSKTEKREGESGSRLLSSIDRHKVVLHTSKKRPLGFSVRGGAEYGLGIYISMVDKGSPADEAGLQVGDQIMDINGHSFASVFHQEAVCILRSYPTLILTIKSLGKLPTLAPTVDNDQEEAKANEKEKGSLRARSFSLPRKFSFKGSPSSGQKIGTEDKPRVATVKRSQSTSERRSLPIGTDSVDFGALSNSANKQRSNGGFNGNSIHNRKKPISVSPLATHESRASPSTSFASPSSITPKFFEQGLGSQVMLASISSQAKELLLDQARRKISANAVSILKEKLEKYEQDGDIKELVDSLIPLLDTPSKMKLLTDIRSVLNPAHIVNFDEMVSPMELQALHKSDTDSESSEEDPLHDYNTVLSPTEQQRWSRMMPLQATEKKPSLPDLGVLGGVETKKSLLQKSSAVASSDPNLSRRARESAVEHHNREPVESGVDHSFSFSKPSPIVVEIPKDSTFLGMAIKGGIDTPLKNVYVRELRQGGAVHNEGFVQPGFEIVQADDKRIRGKTYNEAVESIAECYNSDNTTIKLIVIPNQ